MVSRDQVEVVVARIRPFIQSDGGDIELVDVAGNKATVRMSGNCVGCPSASMKHETFPSGSYSARVVVPSGKCTLHGCPRRS